MKNAKFKLENDLILVEMKILIYMQEFIIFRNMESYDNDLMISLQNSIEERNRLEDNFVDLTN